MRHRNRFFVLLFASQLLGLEHQNVGPGNLKPAIIRVHIAELAFGKVPCHGAQLGNDFTINRIRALIIALCDQSFRIPSTCFQLIDLFLKGIVRSFIDFVAGSPGFAGGGSGSYRKRQKPDQPDRSDPAQPIRLHYCSHARIPFELTTI
ncbi:hypothetical protein SDC9_130866 [bioreactor metagenome]|uniref:Uncharacterized protein n=1 Tax=bioreactor metagenome TaxID=1076179 RepID=A0A645D3R7_9ZZZZ